MTGVQTCALPICKCKRVDEAKLHGPYNILSFSLKEKSSTMSLSESDALLAEKMTERFQKAKSLLNELGIAYVDEGRGNNISKLDAPELGIVKKQGKSKVEKEKSKIQSKKNAENRLEIKNLKDALARSKKKCDKLKKEKEELEIKMKSQKQENKLLNKKDKQLVNHKKKL